MSMRWKKIVGIGEKILKTFSRQELPLLPQLDSHGMSYFTFSFNFYNKHHISDGE